MAELYIARLDSLVRVVVEGRHRARFLHAMTTAEIHKLTPGDATFALVATSNGRHVGQLRIEVEADRLQLIAERDTIGSIIETLKKHKVADDVRFGAPVDRLGDVPTDEVTLAVFGEASAAALAPPAPGRFEDRRELRVTAWDAARSEIGQALYHVRGPAAPLAELERDLIAKGAESMTHVGWDALRIANAWPRDGVDLGPDDLALGSERLLATVSWTKGCFLGQEVFVMARDRGEVPKKLRLVSLEDGPFPEPGTALTSAEGKPAGVLGSSTGSLALAVLKRRAAEPGTTLTLPDGRACRVVDVAPPAPGPA